MNYSNPEEIRKYREILKQRGLPQERVNQLIGLAEAIDQDSEMGLYRIEDILDLRFEDPASSSNWTVWVPDFLLERWATLTDETKLTAYSFARRGQRRDEEDPRWEE